ncbi:MAG: hypothetical protein JWR19_2600 [Pedosphaera sp.]|nr:hypothetical protein [Pedosphaera sp.]
MNNKKVRIFGWEFNRGGAESRRVRKGGLAQGEEQWEQAESAEGASARGIIGKGIEDDDEDGRGKRATLTPFPLPSECFRTGHQGSVELGDRRRGRRRGRTGNRQGPSGRVTNAAAVGGFVSRLQRLGVWVFFPGACNPGYHMAGFQPCAVACARGTMGLMGSQGWSRLGLKIKAGFKGI